jgi:hypothetical protein
MARASPLSAREYQIPFPIFFSLITHSFAPDVAICQLANRMSRVAALEVGKKSFNQKHLLHAAANVHFGNVRFIKAICARAAFNL